MCKTALKPIFFSINKISLDLSIPIVLQTTYTNEDLEIYPVNPVSLVLQILCPTQYVNSYLIVIPGGSAGKESACNAGDPGSIPESGRSSGEGNGHPLQYCHLENPMDRGAWRATVHGVARVRDDLVTKPPPPPHREGR